jgi:small subunit ribosomal protein S17
MGRPRKQAETEAVEAQAAEAAPKTPAKKPRARQGSATARKPIVRTPKPERERGRRKERRGVVVSTAMDKTIVVRVDTVKPHPRYKKVVRRSTKFHAHDEDNVANVGDLVRIVETRPLSKTKRWRLAEVVEAAR